MKTLARSIVGMCLGIVSLAGASLAQTTGTGPVVDINFDEVFDWKKACELTQAVLEARVAPYETVPGSKLHWSLNNREGLQNLFAPKFSPAYQPTYSFFKNPLKPNFVHFYWQGGLMDHVNVIYPAQENEEFPPQLLADMDAAFGVPHASNAELNRHEWTWANYSASARYSTNGGRGSPSFVVVVRRIPQPGEAPPVASATSPPATPAATQPSAPQPASTPAPAGAEIVVNLDDFIDWKTPMNLTLEAFDAKIQALEREAGMKIFRPSSKENYEVRYFDPVDRAGGPAIKYSILDGQYYLKSGYVDWKNGPVLTIDLVQLQTRDGKDIEPLSAISRFDKLFGCPHTVEQEYAYSWITPSVAATLIKYSNHAGYGLRLQQPRNPPPVAVVTPPATPPPATSMLVPTQGTAVPAQGFERRKFDLDLDPVIKWDDPFSLTPQKVNVIYKAVADKAGGPLWMNSESGESTSFGLGKYETAMTLFGGRLKVQSASAQWSEPRTFYITLPEGILGADESWFYDKLDEMLQVRRRRMNLGDAVTGHEWMAKNSRVTARKFSDSSIRITIMRAAGFDPEGATAPLAANLDALLNFSAFWTWTADDFEKAYIPKAAKRENQKKPEQFEWLSAARDRARFSRQMDSNVETKLTMFGGSIKLEEAVLEFVNGKAARATISFYNRGDSGDITTAEFERIFKTIGQNLGQVMKVAPKRQILSSNAALPVTGWMWSSPAGIALLEHNEYNTPGKVTRPEFLRLKLAAPNQADWSMGKLAVGVQRMELVQRVKKTAEGDVYISGVPMVDQGAKGYCVAASCQRLFEYMRIPCDQHEMAKLVNIDAESGAGILTMQKSLAKIDGAFNVTFKPLVNPEQFFAPNGKRRVSEKAFMSVVKEYVDKGVPLLWGLALGMKPEIPPLPGGGQVSGGHMRMVIGYNTAKNQLLFTDSWGAGHELKRMAMMDAYDVTMGLYSMAPRGF